MKLIPLVAFITVLVFCSTTKMCVAKRDGGLTRVLEILPSLEGEDAISVHEVVPSTKTMTTSLSLSNYVAIASFGILSVAILVALQTGRSSNLILPLGCIAMLIFGPMNVLAKDAQTKQGFYEPYLWTMMTFVAQSVFLATSRVKSQNEAHTKASKPPAPLHTYALVTLFDYVTLCLINISYAGLPGSMLQLIKGVKLIFTCILSVTLLQKALKSFMCCGVCFTLAGLICVFIATRSNNLGWASAELAVNYLFIACLSALIGACQYVLEEKVMDQYAVEPELLIGMEGIIGTCYGAIVLVVVAVLKVENCFEALSILRDRREVLIAFLVFSFAVGSFNYSSLVVTKHSSSILRSLLDVVRTSVIWLIEIWFAWVKFSWLELVGFLMVISGTLIYSKIMKVPCLAYD